jgi:L-lactate dehydrogenase complex protein LldE
MAQGKVKSALDAGARYLISTDASCLMHLQGYINKMQLPLQTLHIADVLVNTGA